MPRAQRGIPLRPHQRRGPPGTVDDERLPRDPQERRSPAGTALEGHDRAHAAQKALQNPRSVASTRLKYLLEDASENGGRDPPDRDTLQAAERRLLAEKEVLDEVLRRARGEDPSGEDPFYEDPRSGELR